MADDTVTVFVLHRAITVSQDFDRAPVTPSFATTGFGVKDSRSDFVVREADEVEARAAEIKRQADVDRRVEQLRAKG